MHTKVYRQADHSQLSILGVSFAGVCGASPAAGWARSHRLCAGTSQPVGGAFRGGDAARLRGARLHSRHAVQQIPGDHRHCGACRPCTLALRAHNVVALHCRNAGQQMPGRATPCRSQLVHCCWNATTYDVTAHNKCLQPAQLLHRANLPAAGAVRPWAMDRPAGAVPAGPVPAALAHLHLAAQHPPAGAHLP